jgi:hypothetical protein
MRDYVNEGFDPPSPEEEEESYAYWSAYSSAMDRQPIDKGMRNHKRKAVREQFMLGYVDGFYGRKETEQRPYKDLMGAEWMGCSHSEPGYGTWDNYTR